ncbi:hypothetical protein F4813DRAFT_396849 [Daldinia decipiens]|uniref:uncharacterized protein n=1 Tax=Daldinia decipiens TaxID=326647 RepID=UPI0020C4A38C|nr:uncharacterized protein F4813DRAFT_396849 [Daldinia decipiens]KAI1662138.1 hypothetical protein F4813DRAFT_396849 [Daldinia decipiens]
MPSTLSTSESDSRNKNSPKYHNPMQNSEAINRRKKEQQKLLALKFRNMPNGSRLGFQWDYNRGKMVPFIKDHFTGAIRPATMKDDMHSNMSAEKLEQHRQYHQQMVESLKREQGKQDKQDEQDEEENKS